jgi:hypothetical protein
VRTDRTGHYPSPSRVFERCKSILPCKWVDFRIQNPSSEKRCKLCGIIVCDRLACSPWTVLFQWPAVFSVSAPKTIGMTRSLCSVIRTTTVSLFHRNRVRSATCKDLVSCALSVSLAVATRFSRISYLKVLAHQALSNTIKQWVHQLGKFLRLRQL